MSTCYSFKILCILLLFSIFRSYGQTLISGTVTDQRGNALPGSNIYLLHTLDGTSSDQMGSFSFKTQETGEHVLVISSLGYESAKQPVQLNGQQVQISLQLKETSSKLNEVVISAGTIEANNNRDVAILRPLDIASTAGAGADIASAIQTLPGTQRVGDQTGLFVRGGEASETQTIIDGMVVQNAFLSDVPGVSQRSRFSPFQFKGIAFSSGGYSARYGQALSSVLELNTLDLPEESTFTLGLNMAGIEGEAAKVWESSGLELAANYTNVAPFYKLANTNFDFYDAPEGGGGSARYIWKNGDKGLLKIMGNHGFYSSGTAISNPGSPEKTIKFGLKNRNTYFNSSYKQTLTDKWFLFTAASFSNNQDKLNWGTLPTKNKDWRVQFRGETAYDFSEKTSLLAGISLQKFNFSQAYDTLFWDFDETQIAVYMEAEWKIADFFAVKPGLRFERSHLLQQNSLSPRLSAALKTCTYGQVSLASGIFYQNPDQRYLFPGNRPGFQKAVHYIANYQWIKEHRSFRLEGYYKSYEELIREKVSEYNPNPYRFIDGELSNDGNGYAKGIDIFWRDKSLIKNLDYWVSYSLIDSERLYANFPAEATPTFISNHNLNIITKYMIEPINLNVNVSYNYASGKPFYNPENLQFLEDRTPAYHNLSLSFAYLKTIGKVFTVAYLSIDNITNQQNIVGYRYSDNGQQRYPVKPALNRSVFAGIMISLSAFDQDDL